jgi:hypothetical protein
LANAPYIAGEYGGELYIAMLKAKETKKCHQKKSKKSPKKVQKKPQKSKTK